MSNYQGVSFGRFLPRSDGNDAFDTLELPPTQEPQKHLHRKNNNYIYTIYILYIYYIYTIYILYIYTIYIYTIYIHIIFTYMNVNITYIYIYLLYHQIKHL